MATQLAVSRPVGRVVSMATRGRVPSGRVRVDLSHPDVPDRVRAAVLWHLYERAEIGLIHRYLPRDLDVVELGSSLGITGAHILAATNTRLLAVEANPKLIPALERTLADPRATVVNAAIDYTGESYVAFHADGRNLWGRIGTKPGIEATRVPTVTLSRLRADHDVGAYSLVADIEGAEAALIAEDASALEACRSMIIELHNTKVAGCVISRAELRTQLENLGFRAQAERRNTIAFSR